MMPPSKGDNIFSTCEMLKLPSPSSVSVSIAMSAYPNCIFIIINEKGTIGSILRGTADLHSRIDERQDQFDFDEAFGRQEDVVMQAEEKQKGQKGDQFVYEIKVLLGSTQIQFYELVMRKILELVFEKGAMKLEESGEKCKVILNISLSQVNTQLFKQNQFSYYQAITEKIMVMLPQVL